MHKREYITQTFSVSPKQLLGYKMSLWDLQTYSDHIGVCLSHLGLCVFWIAEVTVCQIRFPDTNAIKSTCLFFHQLQYVQSLMESLGGETS